MVAVSAMFNLNDLEGLWDKKVGTSPHRHCTRSMPEVPGPPLRFESIRSVLLYISH